ncbi:MAG: PIG-L family deacetylase [Cellulomonas sp.]|nr:PIG-L family deacetylase [Cellulomonas sp.]
MSVLDGVRSVLVVHAHPDDETLSTGALLAELTSRGVVVRLLTATRGERGEIVPGSAAATAGAGPLALVRERELDGAARTLGVTARFWLGEPPARAAGHLPRRYLDSGMRWIRPGLAGPAADLDPASFVAAPLDEVVADVGALLRTHRPDLVVSYGPEGGYGHPDHVRTHEASLAASRQAGLPFAAVCPRPAPGAEWFDLGSRLDQVTAALRQHTSQLTVEGTEVVHAGGQREAIATSVGLRLV